MKKTLFTYAVTTLIFTGVVSSADATSINVATTTDNWTVYQATPYYHGNEPTPRGTATYQETTDGLQFFGSGYRAGTGVFTNMTDDFSNSTIRIKWKADGGAGIYWYYPTDPSYMAIGVGLGWQNTDGTKIDGYIAAPYVTTNHSFMGSTLIANDTWYYSLMNISSDRHLIATTSLNNYSDAGGTVVKTVDKIIDETRWSHIDDASIVLRLYDNYGGLNANVTVGEVSYQTEPVPEPGTVVLLGTGLMGMAGVNIRRKAKKSSISTRSSL